MTYNPDGHTKRRNITLTLGSPSQVVSLGDKVYMPLPLSHTMIFERFTAHLDTAGDGTGSLQIDITVDGTSIVNVDEITISSFVQYRTSTTDFSVAQHTTNASTPEKLVFEVIDMWINPSPEPTGLVVTLTYIEG